MITTFIIIIVFFCLFLKSTYAVDPSTFSSLDNSNIYVEAGTPIGSISSSTVISDSPVYQNSTQKRHSSSLKREVNSTYEVGEDVTVELFNSDANTIKTTLVNDKNEKIETQVNQINQQGITTLVVSPPAQLKPGKFTLKITDQTGVNIKQDFLWGVLAINPNKAIYNPGETANLAMAVLNEKGEMVCDAKLTLKITDPDNKITELSTENNKIIINQTECQSSNFTLKPDYQTDFLTSKIGKYLMELTAETKNGSYTITDSFDVQSDTDFNIERDSATRIYPPNSYPMTIKIKATQDFNGDVYDEIPNSFEIIKPKNESPKYTISQTNQNTQKIKWSISLKKGESINLDYQYKAPNISPQFYLIGPLQLKTNTELVYQESRQWQIAADAVTETITNSQNWVVPTNVYSITVEAWGAGGAGGGLAANKVAGRGGGGAGGQYAKKTFVVSPGTTYPVVVGTGATGSSVSGTAGSDSIFGDNTVVAKGGAGGDSYDSGTRLAGVGSTAGGVGDIIYAGGSGSNGGAGTGITGGAGGGGAGSTGAGGNASGNTAGVGTSANGGNGGTGITSSANGNNGNVYGGGGSAGGNTVTNSSTNRNGGAGGNGLVRISYTANQLPNTPINSTPTNSAVDQSINPTLTSSTFSDPDAGDTHTNSQWQIATDSGFSSIIWDSGSTSSNKTSIIVNSSNGIFSGVLAGKTALTNNTQYYWQVRYQDNRGNWSNYSSYFSFTTVAPSQNSPLIPTLSSPTNSATNQSLTPTFQTVTTDANSDYLQYKLTICTNSDMTTNCQIFDQSTDNTGWSGQDVGSSAYSSGTVATFTIQNSLALNTTYYWKTVAKDPAGSNIWSSTQITPYSFTTVTPNLIQASFRWSADNGGENRIGGVGDTWFDTNWNYRQPITVTNNIGTTLSDFQVRLTIGTSALVAAGKMRSDCSDLRITDDNKTTPLNYWIESNCNSTSNTVVWVKIPNLAASATKNLYFYYGYPSASAVSNGDNTFDSFDDFNGTSLDTNKWHDWNPNGQGSINVSGGTAAVTLGNSSGNIWVRGFISNNPYLFTNNVLEYKNKWVYSGAINTSGYYQQQSLLIGNSYPSAYNLGIDYALLYLRYNGPLNIEVHKFEFDKYNSSGTLTDIGDVSTNDDNPSSFEILKYNWYSGPVQQAFHSTDGTGSSFTSLWSTADNTVPLPFSRYFGFYLQVKQGSDGIATDYIDWIRTRKFAATEPTISLGTEITQPPPVSSGATWLTTENVGITNVSLNSNIRLRFSIANTGVANSANFRLQVAPKGGSTNCTDVASVNFSDVPTTAGLAVAVMTTSPNFTNQTSTTNQLTSSGSTFISGKMVENPSNQTDSINLNTNEYTEAEYNFQMTNNATSNTSYCFRLTNNSTALNTYSQVAQLTTVTLAVNQAPNAPYLPFVNNITAQSGQQSPVFGLVDHTPAFSAVFNDPDISDTGSSYQLQIGSDADWTTAEVWDSGKASIGSTCLENSRCTDIVYSGGTSLVDGNTYYWRIKFWDNSDVGSSWSDTQQFSMNSAPQVSSVVLNNNNSIDLSENSSIGVSWTASITDTDGYTNLASVTGKIYRSGVGSSCTPNDNNCYTAATCDFYNCSDNSCNALCSANLYFFTDATDLGSSYADQYYQASVQATDIHNEIGSTTSTSTAVDVNSLKAFNIGSSLVYGEVFAGSNTGSSNTVTTITNTGNSIINLEITGDYMCTDYPSCSSQNIEPKNQQYNLNNFTYGTGTTLSISPSVVNIGISKPTKIPSNSFRNLYWGIGIPSSQGLGNYQGATTILAY